MTLRLGYFEAFDGYDAVLLSCSANDIPHFRVSIKSAMECNSKFAVHEHAMVSVRYPARLFFFPFGLNFVVDDSDFLIPLQGSDGIALDEKLGALEGGRAGHQYFDLWRTKVVLMVSAGEYDEMWWERHG